MIERDVKKLILSSYSTDIYDINYDLKFDEKLSFISGDSGIGKTFLYEALRASSARDNKIICLNIDMRHTNIHDIISKAKNKLIVIDNADTILPKGSGIRSLIARDNQNQYIIFGRDPSGLGVTSKRYSELKQVGNKIILEYPLL